MTGRVMRVGGAMLLALSGLGLSAGAQALTLRESVVEALAFNPNVQSATQDRRIANYQLEIAEAGYVPRLDVEYGVSRRELDSPLTRPGRTQDDSFGRHEGTATLTHILYDYRNVSSQVDRAEARVRSSAYTVNSTAEDIALNTIGAYFELLRRQRTLRLAEENLSAHRRIREMIRRRSAGGISRSSDFDQADSRLALAVASVRQEQGALSDAEAAFLRLSGLAARELEIPMPPATALPGIWGFWGASPPSEGGGSASATREAGTLSSQRPAVACEGWVQTLPVDETFVPAMPSSFPPLALALSPDLSRPPPAANTAGVSATGSGQPGRAPDLGVVGEDLLALTGELPDCPENRGQEPAERQAELEARAYAVAVSLSSHPVVKTAQAQVEAAQAQVQVARSAYAPRLTFEVSGSTSEDRPRQEIDELSAGFRARWNLFNGGADRAAVQAAGAELDKALEQRRRVEQLVTENLSQAGNLLLNSRDRAVVLRRYAEAIRAAQDAYVRQFSIGQRSLLDLVNAQDEVFSARTQLVTVEFTESFAVYRVFAAMGRLLPALDVSLPSAALVE